MELVESLVDNADRRKLKMAQLIQGSRSSNMTIADISHQLKWSYQRTYNVFDEILNDFMTTTRKSRSEVRKALLSNQKLPLSWSGYIVNLIQGSLVFRYLTLILRFGTPNVNAFIEENYISPSTLNRKTAEVRKIMKHYGIRISSQRRQFVGNEMKIRTFLADVYWSLYRYGCWPFPGINIDSLRKEYNTASIDPNQEDENPHALLYLAVSKIRAAKGCMMANSDLLSDIGRHAFSYRNGTDMRRQAHMTVGEAGAFNYYQIAPMSFGTCPDVVDRDIRTVTILRGDLQLDFLQRLKAKFSAVTVGAGRTDVRMQLKANILRLFTGYMLMDGNNSFVPIPNASVMAPVSLVVKDQVQSFVSSLPDTAPYQIIKNESQPFVSCLASLLAPYLKQQKIKVVMLANDDMQTVWDLSQLLKNLSWVSLYSGLEDVPDPDIIVTDCGVVVDHEKYSDDCWFDITKEKLTLENLQKKLFMRTLTKLQEKMLAT